MSAWASRRKLGFLSAIFVILLLIGGGMYLLLYVETPTCTDGKMNGTELGPDCGGACERICPFEISEPAILWARSFEVVPGVYNALAYVENPNRAATAPFIRYRFRFFDAEGILVSEREGVSFLLPDTKNPIFESGIQSGQRSIQQAFFEIFEYGEWLTRENEGRVLRITERALINDPGIPPRLSAVMANDSLDTLSNIEVTAILYDAEGNAISTSQTTVERLLGGGETALNFTWQSPFDREVVRIEIVPRVLRR